MSTSSIKILTAFVIFTFLNDIKLCFAEVDGEPLLISCEDLREIIDGNHNGTITNSFVILDVSWDCINVYKKRNHIPGAFFFDYKHETHKSKLFPFDIPSANLFETYVQSFGIHSDTKVIIYEAGTSLTERFSLSGRVWWLFRYYGHHRVSVLNGGLEKWLELGYPVTKKQTQMPEVLGDFTVFEQPQLRATYEDVVKEIKAIESSNSSMPPRIVDANLPNVYKDIHIPNSVNIPLNEFVNNTTKMLQERDKILSKLISYGFNNNGSGPVIVTCYSGMDASGLAFVAVTAGFDNWRVYVGGYIDWIRRQ